MADRPRYPKSTCCVPFCRRTSTVMPGEWLCRDHWMQLPAIERRLFKRAQRQVRARWLHMNYRRKVAANARLDRLWARLRDMARDTAGGI